jgi:hypothetical protein
VAASCCCSVPLNPGGNIAPVADKPRSWLPHKVCELFPFVPCIMSTTYTCITTGNNGPCRALLNLPQVQQRLLLLLQRAFAAICDT